MRRGDRVRDPRLGERVLAPDVEVRLVGADGERLDRHRLDDRERVVLHQDAVLERARAPTRPRCRRGSGVRRPARRRRPTCGPSGNAAPPRPTRPDAVTSSMTACGTDRASPLESPKAAAGAVVVERGRVDDADAGEQAEAGLAGLRDRTDGRWRGGSRCRCRPSRRGRSPRRPAGPTTPTASTGAATWVSGLSPAIVNIAAGARSHRPRHGERSQVVMPSASGSPAGPIVRSRSAVRSSAPASRQAMSSQTWATIGGRGFVANRA